MIFEDNELLKDLNIEGYYKTDDPDYIIEIIDPSDYDPVKGDWETASHLYYTYSYYIYSNSKNEYVKELCGGFLKENYKDTSTWKELIDMIGDRFGLVPIEKIDDDYTIDCLDNMDVI